MKQHSVHLRYLLASLSFPLMVSCSDSATKAGAASSAAKPQALPVDVRIVTEQSGAHWETAIGSLLPNQSVTIMSELPRKITHVMFRDGSVVKKGQILYQLDDADIRARIREAAAELNLARINERRLHELLKTETIRQEEYDVASAKMQSLQARLDNLQIERSKTTIHAPFSGIAGISKVYPGTLVSPGIPMVDIQEQDRLRISFSVPEKHLSTLRPGTTINFSAADGTVLTAKVFAIDASVDIQSRNIAVQAITDNRRGILKAGMSVKVSFPSGNEALAMAVPTDALIPGEQGFNVYVVRNGIAKVQPVTVANRSEQDAFVSAGLIKGDTVLISNLMRAGDGTPVSIVTAN
jgi:membrane fusion protein (multidrug efflux system)